MDGKPNPGSDAAIDAGCRCPVLDNAHGRGFPWPGVDGNSFWINADCPIHGSKSEAVTTEAE